MTDRAPADAEVLRHRAFEAADLRALRSRRRGKVRLILEVSHARLARLLDPDDERLLYRCSEYPTEAELFSTFDRVAAALAR